MGTKKQNNRNTTNGWSEKQKNIVTAAVLLVFAALIVGICILAVNCNKSGNGAGTDSSSSQTDPGPRETLDPVTSEYPAAEARTDYVSLTVQYVTENNKVATGDIVVHLRPDVAPITVDNFKKLVDSGFYNNLTFHRIIPGFMIQGGDPKGTGQGGSPDTIKGEFPKNGVENPLSHKRGVISMARTGYDMNSASSQFFIVHADSTYLDGDYAAFGEVVSGMEVVDGIARTPTNPASSEQSTPVTPPVILKACFVNPPEGS